MNRIAIFTLLLFSISNHDFPSFSQTASEPSAEKILQNLKERFNETKDYTADLSAEIHFEKMRIPKMEAKIYFKQPNKVHLEPKSGSFAMFPKDAVAFNPSDFAVERYDVVVQGRESINGVNCYKVKLLAKSDMIRLQRIMMYVDPQFWVVKKLSTTPDKGGSADAVFDHQLVQNKFLMTSKITITIDAPTFGSRKRQPDQPQVEPQKGTVIVTYGNYKVNVGLSDDLFKKDVKKK